MSTEQTEQQAASAILAKLNNRATGAVDEIKDTEAKVGGRTLPGGMKNAVATITGAKLGEYASGDYAGEPYIFVYATCVDPKEHHGVNIGTSLMYALSKSMYASAKENLIRFVNDMKLLGLDDIIQAAGSEGEIIQFVYNRLNSKDHDPISFLFNTSNRPKKDGTYSSFIQGLPDDDYEVPELEVKNQQEENGYQPAPKQKKTAAPKKGTKGTKGVKKTSKKKTSAPFSAGDKVQTINDHFEDGKTYTGTVKSIKGETCTILFDDDDSTDTVPFINLVKQEEQEEAPFEVDDRVATPVNHFGDGETWEGTITEVKEDSAVVAFDDGTSETIPFDLLSVPE